MEGQLLKQIENFIKKHSFEITVLSILIAIFSVIMLFNQTIAYIWAGGWILIYAVLIKDEQNQNQQNMITAQEIDNLYVRIATPLFSLLNEYGFLGLHLLNENSIRLTSDYVRFPCKTFPIFRYKVLLKDTFQTDKESLRKILNERIEQEIFYQPLYILHIMQTENVLKIVVILNDCSATQDYISEMEKRYLQKQEIHVDTTAEDF